MKTLFINAAFREGSRTQRIAQALLAQCSGEITRVDLAALEVQPLNGERLRIYNEAVAAHRFDHPMFDFAKQFVEAEEVIIAAPFWNYSIPAVLHSYLELVCTQGISFDISPEGAYFSLCRAKKLVYLTTAGGFIPEEDHAFGYIKSLAESFWHIPDVRQIKAEGLDIWGTDVEAELQKAIANL